MAERWIPLPLDQPLFLNVDPDAVVAYQTAIENGFVSELRGHVRFPGLVEFADLGTNARVYLSDLNGDMIAATSNGQVYRITRTGTVTNVTGVPVSGGRRVVIAPTDRELIMCAGGPIVRLRNNQTELLSNDAPLATHVGWIDGYTLAVELNSGRWFHSPPGEPDVWNPLDSFNADGNPDNINSMIVTPFREIYMGGERSVELFERLPSGDVPFFRRWAVGDGTKLPYAMVHADNALWTINQLTELVRFSGQSSVAASGDIGRMLEQIDDWTDAWIGGYPDRPLHIEGQKFILLQIPEATNPYDSKGITLLYDYRNKRFSTLYGWDLLNGQPRRWPGWSHWTMWDRVYVGGEGKIYYLDRAAFSNGGELQRWLVRTSKMAESNPMSIDGFRVRMVRGLGGNTSAPSLRVRCSRNGRPFGPWITRSLGRAGDAQQFMDFGAFGSGTSFQWEISTADECAVNLIKAEVLATELTF